VTDKCVNNCEFIKFENGRFTCSYYNTKLTHVTGPDNTVEILRSEECWKDGVIGSNDIEENTRKLKKYLSWLADSFYSHKDEFENTLTEMYRVLRSMENRNEEV